MVWTTSIILCFFIVATSSTPTLYQNSLAQPYEQPTPITKIEDVNDTSPITPFPVLDGAPAIETGVTDRQDNSSATVKIIWSKGKKARSTRKLRPTRSTYTTLLPTDPSEALSDSTLPTSTTVTSSQGNVQNSFAAEATPFLDPTDDDKNQNTGQAPGKQLLPFRSIVAFGDNLSDNGNGSYAYKVTSEPGEENNIYGYGTWTDHQVAVSYLADLIHCPLIKDFAFGHAWGGKDSGATVDETLWHSDFRSSPSSPPYFPSQFSSPCNGAPSSKVQVADYIRSGVDPSALHFLWIGNNDVNMETMIQMGDTFATLYASKVADQVTTLRNAGARYVFVVDIYAKQLAPVLPSYFGWKTPAEKTASGAFISEANSALKLELASRFDGPAAGEVLFYDVFGFMQQLWDDAPELGFSNLLDVEGQPACCDDDKALTKQVKQMYALGQVKGMTEEKNWGVCVKMRRWDQWFWMQNLDMTSAVHKYIARDMSGKIKAHWS